MNPYQASANEAREGESRDERSLGHTLLFAVWLCWILFVIALGTYACLTYLMGEVSMTPR